MCKLLQLTDAQTTLKCMLLIAKKHVSQIVSHSFFNRFKITLLQNLFHGKLCSASRNYYFETLLLEQIVCYLRRYLYRNGSFKLSGVYIASYFYATDTKIGRLFWLHL